MIKKLRKFFLNLTFLTLFKTKKIRQSDRQMLMKNFFIKAKGKKNSQLIKRISDNSIKTIVINDEAYWVKDNIFYVSNVKNGMPILNNAKPIDIDSMSKKELDKILFILDNLSRGD